MQSLKEEYPSELCALLLEHTYTEKSFSLKALKGDDRARVQSLFYAAEQSGFRAHLGLVSLYQMGELEYGDDDTMGEIYEEALTIEQWRTPADRPAHLGRFAIPEECLVGNNAFGEGEPDESYAEGFTGNAGCTMEYWYRRAAVVLWPREAEAAIRTEYNFSETARHFRDTAGKEGEDAGKSAAFSDLGCALVDAGLSRLPDPDSPSSRYRFESRYHEMVPVLEGIAESRLEDLFRRIPGDVIRGILLEGTPSLMAATLDAFGSDAVVSVLSFPEEKSSERKRRDAIFHLLDATLARLPKHQALASTVADLLPAVLDAELVEEQRCYRERRGDCYFDSYEEKQGLPLSSRIHLAIAATGLMDNPGHRDKVHELLRSRGRLRHLRDILAPAFLKQGRKKSLFSLSEPGSLYRLLLEEAIEDLQSEIDSPLEPYSDCSRPLPDPADEVPTERFFRENSDDFVKELKTFLLDREAEEHWFRHRLEIRTMLERYIRNNRLDLDLKTEKKGTPHTLVCKKNERSYHEAVRQRKKDKALLGKLRKLT